MVVSHGAFHVLTSYD